MAIVTHFQQAGPHNTKTRHKPISFPSLPNIVFTDKPKRNSQSTATTASNGSSAAVKAKLHRGISSFRSFFKSRTQDDNVLSEPHSEKSTFACEPAIQTIPLSDSSNVLEHLPVNLNGISVAPRQEHLDLNRCSHQMAVVQEKGLKSVASVRDLSRKVSRKFRDTILPSSPTVKVRPELRSRPSVQSMHKSRSSDTGPTLSSDSHASTSTLQKHSSTPPTSEGSHSGSVPNSVQRSAPKISLASNDLVVMIQDSNDVRKLSTIPEVDDTQIATVRTVEATAAAK